MRHQTTRTVDGLLLDTQDEWSQAGPLNAPEPRLRLLYATDPDRIGGTSQDEGQLARGSTLTVGRSGPLFRVPGQGGEFRPLKDPTISREAMRVRWLAGPGCFEVSPFPGARRKLSVVPLDSGLRASGLPDTQEIDKPTRLPPGSCVSIGGRALIGLELAQSRPPTQDRMDLVGECETMWRLREDVQDLGEFGRPVLVMGPTGAGKELIARAVHMSSARQGAFVPVNCAALPEHLVESLLFGHKKGAFTGADSAQEGLFRAADGGTLFLDELGELPPLIQPKILRALQDGQIVSVGQSRSVKVDVRLVAATNRDLEAEVAAGRLREDLYHRVAGHILHVPAMSQRRFDIPRLFMHFLEQLRGDHPRIGWLWEGASRWQKTIPSGFFIDLMRCDWPGNVRELQNIVERTAHLNLRRGAFRTPDLPGRPRSVDIPVLEALQTLSTPEPSASEHLSEASAALGLAHKTLGKLFEKGALDAFYQQADKEGWDTDTIAARLCAAATDRLFKALVANHYKQSLLAEQLGVSPNTLTKMMRHFGIPRPADLSRAQIESALERTGGNIEAAARSLRVSPAGMRKRLTLLNLKGER